MACVYFIQTPQMIAIVDKDPWFEYQKSMKMT